MMRSARTRAVTRAADDSAALRDDLHGQTPLKEVTRLHAAFNGFFKGTQFNAFGFEQGIHKGIIFIFREWAVDVIAFILLKRVVGRVAPCKLGRIETNRSRKTFAYTIPRCPKSNLHIDRLGMDDRCNRIEKEEMFFAA